MKKFLIFFVVILSVFSCKKNKSESTQADFCKAGYIYWGGSYAVDGVGWYFADNRSGSWSALQLKEEELPAAYKTSFTDSTAVIICLKKTDERAPCFCSAPSYFYKIISIQKN
jgi:hypothetical protein